MSWWYFSFKDVMTKDFLGGAVIEAATRTSADARAALLIEHLKGPTAIEVLGFRMPGIPESELPSPPNRNRLLSYEELAAELGEQVQFQVQDGKLVEVKDN